LLRCLSSDNDPLFEFQRWKANLRVLALAEIKTVPDVPFSHPFVERLIGTIRRELLDLVPFWNPHDLSQKLDDFKQYYNRARVHRAFAATTPASYCSISHRTAQLSNYRWRVIAAACINRQSRLDGQFAPNRSHPHHEVLETRGRVPGSVSR